MLVAHVQHVESDPMTKPREGTVVLSAIVVGILIATLMPTGGELRQVSTCLYCEMRSLSDGLLNLMLFLPLGVAFAWRFRGNAWPILAGAALSFAVEAAQTHLPGRDPSLSDLVSNTLGTAIGLHLVRTHPIWRGAGRRHPRAAATAAATVGLAVLALGGWLLQPELPQGAYWWVRWGTSTEVGAPYEGSVLSASVGDVVLYPGALTGDRRIAAEAGFLTGLPLAVSGVATTRPSRVAALIGVSQDPAEAMMLGVDRDAAVLRFGTRAQEARLDQPDVRFEGALAGAIWPAQLRLRAWRSHPGFCITANARTRCGLGYTVGDAWAVVTYFGESPAWLKRLLSALWIAALLMPAAAWLRMHRERAALAVAACATLAVLPGAIGLLPTPFLDYLAALAGIWGAALVRPGFDLLRARPPAPRRSARSARN